MEARGWTDRAAAGILLATGVALLVAAALSTLRALPALLGDEGEHMAGDATLWVLIVIVPISVGGLITVLAARLLWRGSPTGWAIAMGWVLVALLACGLTASGAGNLLAAARMALLEGGGWSLAWPILSTNSGDGATYYTYLDEVTSWIPAIVAVGAVLVACLGITSSVTRRRHRPAPTVAAPTG